MVRKIADLHVLVVEDEPLIQWSLAEMLRQAGATVAVAGTARDALLRLSQPPSPDVVLLDFRLPDSDDLTLLERIRHASPQSAVVMMTACGSSIIATDATERGAYCVIDKPFDLSTLAPLLVKAYRARLH